MAVEVTIKRYLEVVRAQEILKPESERRKVPRIEDFANAASVTKTAFIDFMNNKPRGINRDIMDSSIKLLRKSGFAVGITDLVAFTED